MDKKILLYGTPLNRVLEDDQRNDVNSFSNKRSRINQQQTVRDSSGRQRFHGAFTGGFSAGYYNTVDTAEGFRPKQFISHRGNRNQAEEGQKFSHKPEDYMDDEDFSEFGIAPKKIRVTSEYSNIEQKRPSSSFSSALTKILAPPDSSIGKQILHNSSRSSIWADKKAEHGTISRNFVPKNDFHGLGYKPLPSGLRNASVSSSERFSNPLMAVLKGGNRLKISGEAFGSGVLDDDKDCLEMDDAHGYDDIGNYDFQKSKLAVTSNFGAKSDDQLSESDLISGFVLAKRQDNMHVCDNFTDKYPPPNIPDGWQAPSRQLDSSEVGQKLALQVNQSGSIFNKKFATGSNPAKPDIMGTKAGLVLYSDLKAVKPSIVHEELIETSGNLESIKATIVRKSIEWRPCSLLCKHFNVPNPYPDNSFVGTKLAKAIKQTDLNMTGDEILEETHQEPASYELKRAVFDVIFDEHYWQADSEHRVIENEIISDNEDDPQVVLELESKNLDGIIDNLSGQKSLNEDSDIIVMPVPKPQEPEVIELLSSSPSSDGSAPQSAMKVRVIEQRGDTEEDDIDIYGPPLPPTLRTSIDSDHQLSSRRQRSSKRSKKNKKHKKKK